MKPNVLDKKINFEYLEKDVGLKRFFPDKLLLQQKSKNIKKLIVKGMKEYDSYNEEDCMLLYLEKLKNIWRFDEEIYECQLGVCLGVEFYFYFLNFYLIFKRTWSVPIFIKVSVSYKDGILFFMNDTRDVGIIYK